MLLQEPGVGGTKNANENRWHQECIKIFDAYIIKELVAKGTRMRKVFKQIKIAIIIGL